MNNRSAANSFTMDVPEPGKTTGGMGATYLKIFKLYLEMSARDKALVYGEKAFKHYEKLGDREILQFILEKLGELYDFFDHKEKAINCYSQCKGLQASKKHGY